MLKLVSAALSMVPPAQPPSGGCVLKQDKDFLRRSGLAPAAFRRLCVETGLNNRKRNRFYQPPSGGCVLKPPKRWYSARSIKPAAFRRLCVETHTLTGLVSAIQRQPPSGGCVLKHAVFFGGQIDKGPAAFRRLCVETWRIPFLPSAGRPSRLQAAVC